MRNSGFKRTAVRAILTIIFSALALADDKTIATGPLTPDAVPAVVEAPDPAPAGTSPDPDRFHFDLYPLFGWVPFSSSNFTVPPLPNGGSGTIGGGTNTKFAGAYGFAVGVTYKKLLVEGEGMFINYTGTRERPNVDVSTHLDYGDLFVGWNVGKGFYPIAGFRRVAVDFRVSILDVPTFEQNPGLWDPLFGIEYRKQLKHKINVQGRFDIGGFGVGSTVDLEAQFRVEWRFAKHFGALAGYQVLYDKLEGTVNRQVLNSTINYPWDYSQTFHGPVLGFGIYF